MSVTTRLGALLGLGLVASLFLYRAPELPQADVDERSFLDIPYRFATFGDLRYPVFIAEAFGGQDVRPYPPINSFALRSVALRVSGFSVSKSRYFSAALMLLVLFAAGLWLRSRFGIDWPQAIAALLPAALAPVMILAARTMRHEQETLFFGTLSALLLGGGGVQGLTSSPRRLAVAGGLAAFASGMHPFGSVYSVLALIALLATPGRGRLLPWLGGAAVGASSTIWWFWAVGKNLPASMAVIGTAYKWREAELVAKLSQFSSVAWLRLSGLPDAMTARFASLQYCAFDDHDGLPLDPAVLGLPLRFLFWAEVLLVAHFLFSHLKSRRAEDDGSAWLAFLSLGFLAFTLVYVPNTTYGLYGSFHIHLAFAAACLARRNSPTLFGWPALRALAVISLAVGVASAERLVAAPRVVTLDRELTAMAEVARASGIRPESVVMTSMETWVTAGARNTSLFELITFGTGAATPDALVYRPDHVEFFMATALPSAPERRAKVTEERKAVVARAHAGLHLAGWLLLDEAQGYAVHFFRRGEPRGVSVSSLDPNRIIPLQTVAYGSDPALGPRVACDQRAVPICVFHER